MTKTVFFVIGFVLLLSGCQTIPNDDAYSGNNYCGQSVNFCGNCDKR